MPFAVLLDYAHDRMTLWAPGGLSADEMESEGFHPLGTVPITPSPSDENQWSAHIKFTDGASTAEQDLIVDTGANRTTVPSAVARQLKIRKGGDGQAALFLNKTVTVDFGRVDRDLRWPGSLLRPPAAPRLRGPRLRAGEYRVFRRS